MNSAAVSERYIFVCNTLNGISHISRCDKKSNQVISIEEDNSYVSHLLAKDNKLYSFSSSLDGGESWIDCYDFDLNRIFRIETTKYGSGVYRSCVDGDLFTSFPSFQARGKVAALFLSLIRQLGK